jgi:uncharacterized membrane protein YtjA (UPF0391 family)
LRYDGRRLVANGLTGHRPQTVLGCVASLAAREEKGLKMLHYALVFFVIAIIAAVFGFGGIAAGAVEIGKLLFFIFLILFVASLVAGVMQRGRD